MERSSNIHIIEDSLGNTYHVSVTSTISNDFPGMRHIYLLSKNTEGYEIVYNVYVCNDGEIADEALIDFFHSDLTDPSRYCGWVRAEYNKLVMTANQSADPRNDEIYHQFGIVYIYRVNSNPSLIRRNKTAEILGPPTVGLNVNKDPENVCSICLVPFVPNGLYFSFVS